MSKWNAEHYLNFGVERTRAAADLAAAVRLDAPETIADLGCGPGNSTQVLRSRWPNADIVGVDSSNEMIDSALQTYPDQTWLLADISEWLPSRTFDLVYSNAALQWTSDHGRLIPRLFRCVSPGGALAFQIPSRAFATVRKLIHEISFDQAWTDRMDSARGALTMESPAFYYDVLSSGASIMDIWETEYVHVMESAESIVDWISSTGLRPFLGALDTQAERDRFVTELRRRVWKAYETRADGNVLYPFRRTFVIAYR